MTAPSVKKARSALVPEVNLAAPGMERMGGGLKEPGPEHPGSPTLFVKAHGLQQLSVTFPQDASSPFPSNQVLGTVLSVLEKARKGEGTRASWRAEVD